MIERRSSSLSPTHQRIIHLTLSILWITGALWYYWYVSGDGAPHPNQVTVLRIHGAVAMVFMVVLGTLFPIHIRSGWRRNQNRPSGVSLLSVCLVLILTGWGLYYAGSEWFRNGVSNVHTYLGLALPVVIFLHVYFAQRWLDQTNANEPKD